MKTLKKLSCIVSMILTVMICSMSSQAAQNSGDWEYESYGNTAVITKYLGTASEVTVPEIIDGYTVIGIGESAFEYNTDLKYIFFPQNLKTIDAYAFSGCENLIEITLPENLESLGKGAFEYDTGLKYVYFPQNLKIIDACAFNGCKNLTEITLPEKLETIGGDAFLDCEGLEKITVDSQSLKEVSGGAFNNAGSMSVNGITVKFTDKVTVVPRWMFSATIYGYAHVTNVEIGKNVKSIGGFAFSGCEDLKQVVIPSASVLNTIGESAFSGCKNLTDITFPSDLQTIDESAFSGCKNLTEITLPENLENVGEFAFEDCAGLEKITVNSRSLKEFHYFYGVFSNAGSKSLNGITVIFTDKVTVVPEHMFSTYYEYPRVTEVEIGKNVNKIGKGAFCDCEDLEKITILNKNCSIYDAYDAEGTLGVKENAVVYGYKTSTAQSYANKYGYQFVALPSPVVVDVFSDININSWYVDYVEYVYKKQLMTGVSGTTEFRPGRNISKAQVAQVLYNMEGRPRVTDKSVFTDLKDVAENAWYAEAVAWAYSKGVVTGNTTTKKFNPGASVTREQLATMMYRYAQLRSYDTTETSDLSGLLNANKVNSYAREAVKWAVGTELITGSVIGTDTNGNEIRDLKPQGATTRAQMAAILQRFCEKNGL